MAIYSIKNLEDLTGIKSHTIRIWEQRYGLLEPKRTKTNIRYYDDEQIRILLNVSTLLGQGLKISSIAKMSEEEVNDKIDLLVDSEEVSDSKTIALINQMISAGITYDELLFEKAFSTATLHYGLIDTYVKVLYPMLVRVGLMWNKRDLVPSQEHFISNLVKRKLHTSIDAIPHSVNENKKWVLFLPENEGHEIGLLMSSYLLRRQGAQVVYLGARVPFESLEVAINQVKPENVLFFVVSHVSHSQFSDYLSRLKKSFSKVKFFVAGSYVSEYQEVLPSKIVAFKSMEDFLYEIQI